ncbi:hypothetical protein C3F09_11315 [candidate division GN15 bacterium]|uniref:DUF4097 domain-containing protein n=1 Tax=candidate division GN15 bacterium TaxID=2072418 RepID=A0A855X3N2_9BACT|nr:MAG: hypothetical protein C3F09_11315 [candidate division GN15 bacterium]
MSRAVRIFAYLVCLMSVGLAVRSQQVTEIEPGLFSTSELKASARITTQKRILIRSAESLSGSLRIDTAKGATASLTYRIQARSDDKKKGIDYIDLISVTVISVVDEIRIEMRAPNPAPWEADVEEGLVLANLTLPPGSALDIEAVAFDVTAKGPFRELVIPSSMGRLEISHVTDKLDVNTANQRVLLQNISGDISASTTNANLSARGLDCREQPAKLRNESGDIKIDSVRGELSVRNRYGRTEINGFTPTGTGSFVRSSSGPVLVEIAAMTDGRLVIVNEYEDIELRLPNNLSAALALTVDDDGTIDVSQARFMADVVEHNHLNLRLGQGTGSISASIRGKGNILVHGEPGD